jgi:hypothetical protein
VRYLRDYRSSLDRLGRVLVPTMTGAQIPMAQIADIKLLSGPGMIRDENGRLSGYVYVDISGRDVGGYVADAKQAVLEKVQLPVGYTLVWSGQYEYMERVAKRLWLVIPVTLFLIFLLLYFNRSWPNLHHLPRGALFAVGPFCSCIFATTPASRSGGPDCAARCGCGTGSMPLSRFGLLWHARQGMMHSKESVAGGHCRGSGEASAAQIHDGRRDVHGPHSHHVVHRQRVGCHEAHRRAHDWRHFYFLRHGIAGLPGHL